MKHRPAPITDAASATSELVVGETTESLWLEFKRGADTAGGRPDAARETARDIAAFANAEGGQIVFGVEEGEAPDGRRVVVAIPGIPDPDRLRDHVEGPVREFLSPNALPFETRLVVGPGAARLVVVATPPLPRGLAAVWDRGNRRVIEYPTRTSHGKRYLTPLEVEMRAGDPTRAIQLRVRSVMERVGHPVKKRIFVRVHATAMAGKLPDGSRLYLVEVNDEVLVLDAATRLLHIPYELVRASCVDGDGVPAVWVDARIIFPDEGNPVAVP